MSERDSIVVLVEPDIHPQVVVSRAIWLAQLADCDLHFYYCDHDVGALDHGLFATEQALEYASGLHAAQMSVIGDLTVPASDAGLEFTLRVLEERPSADALLEKAAEIKPRYIVKGTEFHSAAERGMFLDTDWQLIRACPYPLWLVKPHDFADNPVVVAAVDPVHSHDKPAALDRRIIEAAQAVTGPASGDLHLFHSYHRIAGVGREATKTFKPLKLPIDELSAKIKAEHRQLLDNLAQDYDIDAEHTHQLPGSARELLPVFARTHKTDLVVMGALARWGLRRMVLGSTAERVLDHLHCDILIVRPDDAAGEEAVAV